MTEMEGLQTVHLRYCGAMATVEKKSVPCPHHMGMMMILFGTGVQVPVDYFQHEVHSIDKHLVNAESYTQNDQPVGKMRPDRGMILS